MSHNYPGFRNPRPVSDLQTEWLQEMSARQELGQQEYNCDVQLLGFQRRENKNHLPHFHFLLFVTNTTTDILLMIELPYIDTGYVCGMSNWSRMPCNIFPQSLQAPGDPNSCHGV